MKHIFFILIAPMLANAETLGEGKKFPYTIRPACAAFSRDGKFVLVGFGHGMFSTPKATAWDVQLFDIEHGKHVRSFKGHEADLTFIQFFPDGERFLSADQRGGCRIWDVKKGIQVGSFASYVFPDQGTILPDGKRFLLADSRSLQMWDVVTGKQIQVYRDIAKAPIFSLALSPDGKRAILAHSGGHTERFGDSTLVRLWDVEKGNVIRSFDPVKEPGAVPSVFAGDSKQAVLTRNEKRAHYPVLIEVESGKEIKRFSRIEAENYPIRYHVDKERNRLIIAGGDGTFWRLDLKTGKEVWSAKTGMGPGVFVSFSANGKWAISGHGQYGPGQELSLMVWDLEQGRVRLYLRPLFQDPPMPKIEGKDP